MQKLIDRYLADPSIANARRIRNNLRKHPMCVVALVPKDQRLVKLIDQIMDGVK